MKRGYSVDWKGLESEGTADIRFDERAQQGVERNYTYHVDRGKLTCCSCSMRASSEPMSLKASV